MEIVCVPIIIFAVYAIIELYKTVAKSEAWLRIIPILGALLGGILGGLLFWLCPNLISANNLFGAIVIGVASGLSSTGCNQIFKQLKKFGIVVNEPKESTPNEEKEAENAEDNPPTNEK